MPKPKADHSQLALLELPTNTLLDKFGAGRHTPGSGSAAALMGILSAKLALTVCSLTLSKPKYKDRHAEINLIVSQIKEKLEPLLRELFHQDAVAFDNVIKIRIAKKRSTDPTEKNRLAREHQALMKTATEIPLRIGHVCIQLIGYSIYTFDFGFQSARGDSGAALSAAIAGVSSAIFVMNLNLKSFPPSKWKEEFANRVKLLTEELDTKQTEAFARITQLSEDDVEQLEMDILKSSAENCYMPPPPPLKFGCSLTSEYPAFVTCRSPYVCVAHALDLRAATNKRVIA